jgi:hypothetical protein
VDISRPFKINIRESDCFDACCDIAGHSSLRSILGVSKLRAMVL